MSTIITLHTPLISHHQHSKKIKFNQKIFNSSRYITDTTKYNQSEPKHQHESNEHRHESEQY